MRNLVLLNFNDAPSKTMNLATNRPEETYFISIVHVATNAHVQTA